jgi:opacity protein-like surface antigen
LPSTAAEPVLKRLEKTQDFLMKTISFAVLAVAGVLSASVQAASTGPYLGAKIGSYMVDDSDTNLEFDNATSFGVMGGYHFGEGLSVEAEYNTSSGTDVNMGSTTVGEYDLSSFGVYAAYRHYPALYKGLSLKAKIGVVNEEVEVSAVNGLYNESSSDSGLSFGVGVGFDLNRQVALEGEYTVIEQDVNLLSLGLKFKL